MCVYMQKTRYGPPSNWMVDPLIFTIRTVHDLRG